MMEILLVRHGKTQGNLERRYVGRTDEPLLEASKAELETSVYASFLPEFLYISPLIRCRQTAELIFGTKIPSIFCDDLKETDFGDFEYMNYPELKDNPAYQEWIDGGGIGAFPNGESGVEFRERCANAFASCVEDAREKGYEKIAFVVHGGTIMSAMERFAQPKEDFYHWQVGNGGGYIVTCSDETGAPVVLQLKD